MNRYIQKTVLFTVYYVNDKITCVRDNLTGKFVSRKNYLAVVKPTIVYNNDYSRFFASCFCVALVALMVFILTSGIFASVTVVGVSFATVFVSYKHFVSQVLFKSAPIEFI